MKTLESPQDLEWFEGPLPPVETVPYDCSVVCWLVLDFSLDERNKKWFAEHLDKDGQFAGISTVNPWKDALNPIRWSVSGGLPCENGIHRVKYWAWINKGTA